MNVLNHGHNILFEPMLLLENIPAEHHFQAKDDLCLFGKDERGSFGGGGVNKTDVDKDRDPVLYAVTMRDRERRDRAVELKSGGTRIDRFFEEDAKINQDLWRLREAFLDGGGGAGGAPGAETPQKMLFRMTDGSAMRTAGAGVLDGGLLVRFFPKSSSSHLLHSHASFHVTVRNASLTYLLWRISGASHVTVCYVSVWRDAQKLRRRCVLKFIIKVKRCLGTRFAQT